MDKDLEAQIAAAKLKLEQSNQRAEQSRSWQFLSELIAGLMVGGGVGWMPDNWLGTKPWLFVVFLVVGMAAAFWNMFRLASADEIRHTGRD